MLPHVGADRAPAGPVPGVTGAQPIGQPRLTSLPAALPLQHREEAVPYSPEAAAVGLAQDTVVWWGQGIKPEAGKALVGLRLRGGGALKSIVAGGEKGSGDRLGWGWEQSGAGRGPHHKGLQYTHLWGHTALPSLEIRVTLQVRRVAEGVLGTPRRALSPAWVSWRAAWRRCTESQRKHSGQPGEDRGGALHKEPHQCW